jgi:hypothetical protein
MMPDRDITPEMVEAAQRTEMMSELPSIRTALRAAGYGQAEIDQMVRIALEAAERARKSEEACDELVREAQAMGFYGRIASGEAK